MYDWNVCQRHRLITDISVEFECVKHLKIHSDVSIRLLMPFPLLHTCATHGKVSLPCMSYERECDWCYYKLLLISLTYTHEEHRYIRRRYSTTLPLL